MSLVQTFTTDRDNATDTLGPDTITYIATVTTITRRDCRLYGILTLLIGGQDNRIVGTVVNIKNNSNPPANANKVGPVIRLIPQDGTILESGGVVDANLVRAGRTAQILKTGPHAYLRLV